jgi:UPF0755 protein
MSEPLTGGPDDEIRELLTPKPRRKRRWVIRALIGMFVLLVLAGVGVGVGASMLFAHVTEPRPEGPPVQFEVPEGASGIRIAQLLADAGLVEHETLFRVALRLHPGESIQYGTYRLPTRISPVQLLEYLRRGPIIAIRADDVRVTIPEGLTLYQMGALLGDPHLFTAELETMDVASILGFETPTYEGFLMPNTYFFQQEPEPRALALRMLEQFRIEYEKLLREFPDQAERDPLEVVTIASLIEEEARVDDERPLVASVIYNRLARNRTLDLDSTLQFALNKYGQRLLNVDKEVDSPYNTYRNAGLPPGPISNPGPASLRAAMNPAESDYLYFVSNADGKTHTFSRTLAEHNAAVARYRREIREQRRQLSLQEQ